MAMMMTIKRHVKSRKEKGITEEYITPMYDNFDLYLNKLRKNENIEFLYDNGKNIYSIHLSIKHRFLGNKNNTVQKSFDVSLKVNNKPYKYTVGGLLYNINFEDDLYDTDTVWNSIDDCIIGYIRERFIQFKYDYENVK